MSNDLSQAERTELETTMSAALGAHSTVANKAHALLMASQPEVERIVLWTCSRCERISYLHDGDQRPICVGPVGPAQAVWNPSEAEHEPTLMLAVPYLRESDIVVSSQPDHGAELEEVQAALAEWISAGAQPWDLPAAAAHFVLDCHGCESVSVGTWATLLAVSDECEECCGEGEFRDESHPAAGSTECDHCKGHGRVPKRTAMALRAGRSSGEQQDRQEPRGF